MQTMEKVYTVAKNITSEPDSEVTEQQKSLLDAKTFTLMQKKFTFLEKKFTTFIKNMPNGSPKVNQCKPR